MAVGSSMSFHGRHGITSHRKLMKRKGEAEPEQILVEDGDGSVIVMDGRGRRSGTGWARKTGD
jgi:hypothetical protein